MKIRWNRRVALCLAAVLFAGLVGWATWDMSPPPGALPRRGAAPPLRPHLSSLSLPEPVNGYEKLSRPLGPGRRQVGAQSVQPPGGTCLGDQKWPQFRAWSEDAVLQGRTEELDERHGPWLPTPQALPPCPPALQGEHRAQEDGE